MAAKTKDRILAAALAEFNRHGESNVTTGAIADAVNISSGNLHYHFPTKQELTWTLFSQYEREMLSLLATPPDRSAELEDIWLLMHLSFELMGRYEFVFQDLSDLCHRYSKIRHHFNGILKIWGETLRVMLSDFEDQEMLDISPQELTSLIDSILLISFFWPAYGRVSRSLGGADPNNTVIQIMGLISPYLIPEARAYIKHLVRRYQ